MDVLAATTLAGHSSPGWALAGGLVGGGAFLAVVYMGRAIRMTRMNFLDVLGTMLVPRASQTTVYTVGLMAHLMMSAAFGLAHAGLLHSLTPDGTIGRVSHSGCGGHRATGAHRFASVGTPQRGRGKRNTTEAPGSSFPERDRRGGP